MEKNMSNDEIHTEGRDKLWHHFGFSYASWFTLPRVLMHEMPDEWQGKMADLLDELDATFPKGLDMDLFVHERRASMLERWMWVYLESGTRPDWAHKGIDNQDLKDMIASAIRKALEGDNE